MALRKADPWTKPQGIYLPKQFGRPPEISEIVDAVPGPDQRFQDHRAGCKCGDLDCPWFRGEETRRRWDMASEEQRAQWAIDTATALSGPPAPLT